MSGFLLGDSARFEVYFIILAVHGTSDFCHNLPSELCGSLQDLNETSDCVS